GFDPQSKFYACESQRVIGYAAFNPNGRVSFPWCLPGHESAQGPLLAAVIDTMTLRDFPEAWAAYRGDWLPVLEFLQEHGFTPVREMVNFVAETKALPGTAVPPGLAIGALGREEMPHVRELSRSLFAAAPERLDEFYWENPFFGPDSL